MTETRSEFDAILMRSGPPAVFSIDGKGRLGLDEMRTREHYNRVDPPVPFEPCHCLYRDHATGFVQYLLVTSAALCATHPRADIHRFDDAESAMAVLSELGDPPIRPEPF
jgi:hypothetical protein